MSLTGPFILIILDGWGLREEATNNAVALAPTPNFDALWEKWPRAQLRAHGEYVGLPPGQIGNSEVGHLNLGAGRIVEQDIVRIDNAFRNGRLRASPVLRQALDQMGADGRIHLVGLFSDGGVHSHINHMNSLWALIEELGSWPVYLHCFLDGRDVPPASALRYFHWLEERRPQGLKAVATVIGRYYAMDRDRRWERTRRAYDAMVLGEGYKSPDPITAVEAAYDRGETDEFVQPTVITTDNGPVATIEPGDLIIFYNFRADRARQLVRALSDPSFSNFPRPVQVDPQRLLTMVEYDPTFPNPVLLPPEHINRPLGEVIAEAGLSQLRIAETEKYAHVTYFFNGGREEPFPGEKRILVPSPQVATYDLAPAMSALEVTDRVINAIQRDNLDFIVLNYANPDMVGHTGKLDAAIEACRVTDLCLGRVIEAILAAGGAAIVCADHGNAELMVDPESGEPHTAHTTNPVPLILVDPRYPDARLRDGILADVAPTVLDLLDIEKPPEMTRSSLLVRTS